MPRPAPSVVRSRDKASPCRSPRASGFALIVTIVLVAFLVLILVGLASFTRVETRVAANSQSTAQARQNALMALNLALGQLQRHAGPDQRATATADVIPPSGHTWATVPANPTAANYTTARASDTNSIESGWSATGNRHWTGAWLNQKNDPADYDANDPAAFNPTPILQSWLVSGNESSPTGDEFKPTDAVAGLTATSTALDRLGTSAKPYRLLVKNAAAADADLRRAVTAPEIAIRATSPGVPVDPDTGEPPVVGHYAWWVGDEGVKARANLLDPYYSTDASAEDNITRLQSAQRPAIETMTSDGTDGFARLDPFAQPDLDAYKARLANTLTPTQLAYLAPSAPTFPAELKNRYHDFSLNSFGVLSDTRNGGLKNDLTYLFGQRNLDDFRTALTAAYGTNNVAPSASSNRVFTPASTIYATFPTDDSSSAPYADAGGVPGVFAHAPTWEQLWSFANMGNAPDGPRPGVFTSEGAQPRRQTADQQGIHPILIQFKYFYRVRIVGGSAEPDASGIDVNRSGNIWIDVIPVVVLANPYAVPLAPAEYQLHVGSADVLLVFGSADAEGDFNIDDFAAVNANDKAPKINVTVIYNLRSSGMAAGEARMFTIDETTSQNPTITTHGPYSLVPYINSNASPNRPIQFVTMKDELDLLTGMTLDTGRMIPADKTHVALRGYQPFFNTKLYMDVTESLNLSAHDEVKMLQFVRGQSTNTVENNSGGAYFILNPLSENTRQGGGYYMLLNQPPIKAGAAPGYFSNTWVPQQAPFLQVNYRGNHIYFGGSDSGAGGQNTVEWARAFAKNGSNGTAGDMPSAWLEANLVRPAGEYEKTRWGLFSIGEGSALTEPPSYLNDNDVGLQNLLYDIPRPGHPLATIGQLQHFNTTGFTGVSTFPGNIWHRQAIVLHSWQSSYAISNSYPNPRVSRERLFDWHNKMGRQFDGSYLWNDVFWDRFYFSTFPQTDSFDFSNSNDRLINARLRPFRDQATTAWDHEANFRGDDDATNEENPRIAASNLLITGAFNINSTSVDAWKSIFSSLKKVPIAGNSSTVAPFSRTLTPLNDSTNAAKGNTQNSWNGFYDFTESDIQKLAEEMVMQIRKRGPFTSLSEFVNRRLTLGRTSNAATSPDPLRLGLSGALQAALDVVINQRTDLAFPFDMQAKPFVGLGSGDNNHNATRDPDFRLSSGLAGIPGYVLQGDVLSALGASLSARSDSFTIRTYGDSVNPATGDVTGRAWCEAVVQRLPDYVRPESVPDGDASTKIANLHADNQTFGRRFHIVSFRWLSAEDI